MTDPIRNCSKMAFNHWGIMENRLGSGQSLDLATVQELLGHRDVSTTMV